MRVHRTRPTGQLARRLNWKPRIAQEMEVVRLSTSAGDPRGLSSGDLPSLAELIRLTPGAHPIGSVDELRCDVFGDDQELDDFLAFVTGSRHAGLA
jgi:hypothetical protein